MPANTPSASSGLDYDVLVIGYGPVGQTAAALLGARGHRVGVFERWTSLYPLPRAGHVDHEIMRILQSLGTAEQFEPHAIPIGDYDWFNADGDVLLHVDWNLPAPSGWKSDYLMFQPDLQDALHAAASSQSCVDLQLGWVADEIRQLDDHVEVEVAEGETTSGDWVATGRRRTVTARYLIGADGANSTARAAAGIEWRDLGFEEDWLVVDIKPHDAQLEIDMPDAGQICDPERPVSLFRWLGREHVRWEFMLLPGETADELTAPERCWELVSRWKVTPDVAELTRRTVYTFRSAVAETWRRDRILLVGDAAHIMPPFMGQGMCSGIRDAANLAWKLDLVLAGRADAGLLDTYEAERRPHSETVINMSMALGQVVCMSDPAAVEARDEAFRTGQAPPPDPFPHLVTGLLDRADDGAPTEAAGHLGVQPRVWDGERCGRMDDIAGGGWHLISRRRPADLALSQDDEALLDRIGARRIHLTPAKVPGALVDVDVDGTRWLNQLDADVVLVRPDFYVFGACRADRVGELLATLREQLGPPPAQPAG